jgi:hypothetical protein
MGEVVSIFQFKVKIFSLLTPSPAKIVFLQKLCYLQFVGFNLSRAVSTLLCLSPQ